MSDELERLFRSPVQAHGTSDHRPFASRDDAQRYLDQTLTLLKKGMEMGDSGKSLIDEAHEQLRQAHQRQIWRTLGFDSMANCLVVGLSNTFSITIAAALRQPLVIAVQNQEVITTKSPIVRTLNAAAPREPRVRRPPATGPKRRDFKKSWGNTLDTLLRFDRSIAVQRRDSRYREWLADLADRHEGDLQRHYELCGEILADFARARAKNTQNKEN